MINRILYIGTSELPNEPQPDNFKAAFNRACSESEVELTYFDTKETCFHIRTGAVDVVLKNETVDFSNSFIFVRRRKYDFMFVYLLVEFAYRTGIPFNDPINRIYTHASSKPAQILKLALEGLPVPETFLCSPRSFRVNEKYISEHLNFPCVIKGSGSKGRAVWKINSKDDLITKIKELESAGKNIFSLQEYIENEGDIRVMVFKDKAIGAVERVSDDGFYNNISKGAKAKPIETSEEVVTLARRAAKITEVDFAGVDMVERDGEYLFFEVNKVPGIRSFKKSAPEGVLEAILNQ